MLICGGRFKPDRPLEFGVPQSAEEERARLRKAVPRENFGFGQEVVQWYRSRGLVPAPPQPAAAAAAPGSGGSGSRRLKVLFMRRDSGGRQLLNAEELVRSCNAWRYTLPGGGGTVTADCRQVRGPTAAACRCWAARVACMRFESVCKQPPGWTTLAAPPIPICAWPRGALLAHAQRPFLDL